MEDYQAILNWAMGLALSVTGWFARQLWDAVKDLKTDLSKLREEIAKDYVPKTEWRGDLLELRGMLQRIYDKLDEKADK
jgi:hypothetical protein